MKISILEYALLQQKVQEAMGIIMQFLALIHLNYVNIMSIINWVLYILAVGWAVSANNSEKC